jgi:hypothetical protein
MIPFALSINWEAPYDLKHDHIGRFSLRHAITDGKDAVRVIIATQGRAFDLKQEIINEDVRFKRQPVRLGIALTSKILAATIVLRISPVTKQIAALDNSATKP